MPIGTDFLFDAAQPGEYVLVVLTVVEVVSDTVGDGINVLESVTIEMRSSVVADVHDDVTGDDVIVLEDVTIAFGTPSAAVSIVVSDDVNETEAVSVQIPMAVVVSDDDTAAESVAVAVTPLFISVSDDDVATELVVVLLPDQIMVSDSVSATEFVNLAMSIQIDVFDDNTFPPLEPPPMPATGIARDYVDVTEGVVMGLGLPILVGDDLTVDEAVAIALPVPVRVVDDIPAADIIVTDAITINPVLLGFDTPVADQGTPAEFVAISLALTVSVVDDQAPADVAVVAPVLAVVVSDDVTVTDAVDARSPVSVRVGDDVTIADEVDALLSVLLLEAADAVPSEDAVVAGIPLGIIVEDTCEGGPDIAIGERRLVLFTDPEDLHFIQDATTPAGSSSAGRVTRHT